MVNHHIKTDAANFSVKAWENSQSKAANVPLYEFVSSILTGLNFRRTPRAWGPPLNLHSSRAWAMCFKIHSQQKRIINYKKTCNLESLEFKTKYMSQSIKSINLKFLLKLAKLMRIRPFVVRSFYQQIEKKCMACGCFWLPMPLSSC